MSVAISTKGLRFKTRESEELIKLAHKLAEQADSMEEGNEERVILEQHVKKMIDDAKNLTNSVSVQADNLNDSRSALSKFSGF